MIAAAIALALCMLLSGCGTDLSVNNEYSRSTRIVVPIAVPRTSIHDLAVRFHPTDHNRGSVIANSGSMAEAIGSGADNWIARISEINGIYSDALLAQLRQEGRSCSVVRSFPYPALFMIDFEFNCDEANH